MIRVVRLPDGELAVDRQGQGRGAWLCLGSVGCLSVAVRHHAFERALRASIEAGAVERLRTSLTQAWEQFAPDVRG
jgi:predicted RNA-binding protein YlxR (DUF448 family)